MWEVDKRGFVDVNGVKRARNETTLRSVQNYFDCLLCGYILVYLLQNQVFVDCEGDCQDKQFLIDRFPFIHYYFIVDAIITLLLPAYVYLSKIMICQTENHNRMVTLSMFQFQLMLDGNLTEKQKRIQKQIRAQQEQERRMQLLNDLHLDAVLNLDIPDFKVEDDESEDDNDSDLEPVE